MKINYVKSRSSIKPELIDTTSSKSTVYLRKNIVEVERNDMNDDSSASTTFYEYDEAKLTKQEYQEYLKELEIIDIQKQRADIDYIALMSGIDLEA